MKLVRLLAWIPFSAALAVAEKGPSSDGAVAAPSEVRSTGVALRLLADHEQVARGSTFTVGLSLRHDADYHTYWRSPGLVGLPTSIEWNLPEGINAGPLLWPGPELSSMAQITVWGYERDVVLLTEVRVAPDFAGEVIPLRGKVSWMACAKGCFPGWSELLIEIPVGEARVKAGNSKLIAASREQIPVDLPPNWTFEARRIREEAGFRVEARLKGPRELVTKDLVFFCDDYQVNSNVPQHFTSGPKGLEMRFPVSDFAPDNATRFSGVLYHPDGWPGMKTKWLRVSADYR